MTRIQRNINYHLGHAYSSLLRLNYVQDILKIPKLDNRTNHTTKGRIVAFTWKTLNRYPRVLFYHGKKNHTTFSLCL